MSSSDAAAFEVGQPATTRETPVARLAEAKVIPFPAQRPEDPAHEPPKPEPAPAVRAPSQSLAEAIRESVAPPVEPPPAAPSHEPVSAVPVLALSEAEPAAAPAATEREPIVARRAERVGADLTSTAIIGSPAPVEQPAPPAAVEQSAPAAAVEQSAPAAAVEQSAPAAAVEAASSHTEPLPKVSPAEPESATRVAASAAASAPVESTPEPEPVSVAAHAEHSPHDASSAEDVHDEFFSAGETGSYVGGSSSVSHSAVDDHQEFDDLAPEGGRRVIQRSPEQEARRERNIKVVSGLVGVGLAIACVALWRSHRAASTEELAPPPSVQMNAEATPIPSPLPVAPLEPRPAVTEMVPAPPAEGAAPPKVVEPPPRSVAPPTPPVAAAPSTPPAAAKPAAPAADLPAEVTPKPTKTPKPAAAAPSHDQPAPTPAPERPATVPGKPPTAAFPLQ